MSTNDTVKVSARLSEIPISAPVWVWIAYGLLILSMCWIGLSGGFNAIAAVIFTAGFSFQFWTFAIHRGLRRRMAETQSKTV